MKQAQGLRDRLAGAGTPLPVYVGMRNWTPYLAEALAAMRADGIRRAIGVVLAPHRTFASWEQYRQNVEDARAGIGAEGTPQVEYLEPWHAEPGFLEAMAERVEEAAGHARGAWPPGTHLLFTAHSVPTVMAESSPYAQQLAESAAGVAAILGAPRWRVAYQSRSGDPRQPWLEPDVNDVLRAIARDAEAETEGPLSVVLVPVGFLCDHVEVLYDLDVEAMRTAAEVGLECARAGTVGDHPRFIAMLAERILARA